MVEQEILQALQHSVGAAVAASSTPTLPVGYVDVTQPDPNDQKWLELIYIPNNGSDQFWGDEKQYQGIFRMILHWPIDGGGAYGPMQVLQSIAGHYTKSMQLENGVKITSNPDLTGVIAAPPELLFPCTLRYTRFAPAA